MQYPQSVLNAVAEAGRKHPSDIPLATEEAERAVRALPEFDEIVGQLVHDMIRELIYRDRGATNHRIKTAAGEYGEGAKVRPGESNGVADAYQSLFDQRIGSRILGDILGEELLDIAANESSLARGHTANARFFRELRKTVPDGKKVREAITEKKLTRLWNSLRKAKAKPREKQKVEPALAGD